MFGDVSPGAQRRVSAGHCAHISILSPAAAGRHQATVGSPLDHYAGQGVQFAAAQGLHGVASSGGNFPLALSGMLKNLISLSLFLQGFQNMSCSIIICSLIT